MQKLLVEVFVLHLFLTFKSIHTQDVQLIVQPQNVTVSPGQQIDLKCVFNKKPPTDCYWSKDNQNFEPDGKDIIFSGQLSKGNCSIRIPDSNVKDDGYYRCAFMASGSQDGLMSDPPAKVTVLKMPNSPQMKYNDKIVKADTPLRFPKLDSQFTVQCMVRNGNPAANIKWFLDTIEKRGNSTSNATQSNWLTTVSEVQIFTDRSTHTKYLSCNATHPAYNTTSNMQSTFAMILIKGPIQKAEISFENITSTVITLNYGEPIKIICIAFSEPDPIYQWQKQAIGSNVWKDLDSERETTITLSAQAGYYRCGARNSEMVEFQYSEKLEIKMTSEQGKTAGRGSGAIIAIVILAIAGLALATASIYYMHLNKKCCFKKKDTTRRQEMSELNNRDLQDQQHKLMPDSKISNQNREDDAENVLNYAVLEFNPSTGQNKIDMGSTEAVNYATVLSMKSPNEPISSDQMH